jgi:phosphatidylserine/phosphatidylglycerophosphate/cardiolipin synthase-like enzyme
LDKRPTNPEGKRGSLHIKAAIADRKKLFISSANLTEYALTLNMEMGLLVYNQELANQIADHVNNLIRAKTFTPNHIIK